MAPSFPRFSPSHRPLLARWCGSLGLALAFALAAAPAAAQDLTGDTSRPDVSTFAIGEKVELTFRVTNLEGGSPLKLQVSIVDEREQPVASREVPVQAGAGGKFETKIEAPAAKVGFYRVRAKLSNGVLLKGEGSREAGFLTYAVVPDPAKRQDHGEKGSRFGMQGGFGKWRDEVLGYLGARWVLDGSLEWKKQEPERAGQFDPEAMLAKLAKDPPKDGGWKKYTLPTFMAAPEWAVVPAKFKYMTGTLTPEGEKAWDDYCRKATRVFMAKNPDREERIYQVTWEPVRPWGFKGTDAELIRIFEIAHRAIHETDPKALVAGPTQGLSDPEKTIPLLERGLAKYIEAFTIHPYFSITGEREGMVDVLRRIKAALPRKNGETIPMLGTEQGYSTEENVAQELTQARGLLRQNLMMLGEGYRMNMAFYITDYRMAGQKGYGYYYNLVESVPFGPAKIGPRPIVPAYAVQSLLLDGRDPAQTIEWLGQTAWGYAFQRGDDVVLALWDYGDEPSQVVLPTGSRNVRALDWMGRPLEARMENGDLALELGPEPLYVTGVSAKLWGSAAAKLLSVKTAQPEGYPGAPASIQVALQVPEGFDGTLVVAADQRLGGQPMAKKIALAAGESSTFEVAIDVPADAKPGRYPVRLVAKNAKGESVAVSGFGLRVAPPIAVASVDPMPDPQGGYKVGVVLRNERSTAISGRLSFELRYSENTARQVPFQLGAGETQRMEISYPASAQFSPTAMHQVVAKVETSGGYTFSETRFVNFLAASRLVSRLVIDGNSNDWTGGKAVRLGRSALVREPKQYSGDDDLAAEVRYAWDEDALYALVEVTDDAFNNKYTAHDSWRGDSVQLAINLDPRKETVQTGNVLADVAEGQRFSEITIARTATGIEAFRHHAYDPEALGLGPIPSGEIKAAVKTTGTKTTYEIAIPWRTLGARSDEEKRRAGDLIAVAAILNDADSADEKMPAGLALYGGITPTKNPEKFGLMVLEGARGAAR